MAGSTAALRLFQTEHFKKGFAASGPVLQEVVASRLRRFALDFAENPSKAMQVARLNTITYMEDECREAREMRLSHFRAIAKLEDHELILLRLGPNGLVKDAEYTPSMFKRDVQAPRTSAGYLLRNRTAAAPPGFFLAPTEGGDAVFADAQSERWLYQLEGEQERCLFSILDSAGRASSGAPSVEWFLVFGGPGTGKTVILTQVLNMLDWDRRRAQIIIGDELAQYLASTGHMPMTLPPLMSRVRIGGS